MTATVAVVTGARSQDQAAEADAPLLDALARAGAQVERPSWRDDVDWSRFDAAIVRSTWDYADDRDGFVVWAARAGSVTSLWNPPEVLRWNTHKGHLMELEERGAPIVPTAWLGQGDRVTLAALRDARGWDRVVVKPAVANGGDGLWVSDGDDAAAQRHLDALLVAGDVMVQPLLERVTREGETSVIVIDGEVTHVVRKTPADGELRVQSHRGGTYERVDDAGAAALGAWVAEATGHELLFARIDLLRADDGAWQVGEVELTEPDLYLRFAPHAADRLAAAVLARAGAT